MFLVVLRDIIAFFAGSILLYAAGADLLYWLRIRLSRVEHVIVATGFGIATLTLLSYALAWTNLRILIPVIPYLALGHFLWKRREIWKLITKESIVSKKILILFSIFSLCFLIPYYSSGDFGSFVSLIGVHYSDSPLHIALINELKRQFPPMDPGMAGARLSAYHFFYNFASSILSSSLFVSSETIHFRVMPIIFAILWPFLVFFIARELFRNTIAGVYSVFFSMFGTSFSWYILWKYHIPLSFDSGLGILQPPNSLLNPPFASSVIVLLLGIYGLIKYEKSKNYSWLVPTVICLGSVVEYKVYAGIVALAGLGIYTLIRLWRDKARIVIGGVLALCIAFVVYWPFTGKSGFLIWAPLWAPHEVARNVLTFLRYDNAVYVYGRLFDPMRIVGLELTVLWYFIIGNFGLRTIGLILLGIGLFRKSENRILYFVFGIMFLVSFLVPLLCMQSLKPFEISQMFNYSLLILSFPTGYFFALLGKKWPKVALYILAILVAGTSLPQLVTADYQEYVTVPVHTVTGLEYQLYQHIQKVGSSKDVVLEMPPREEQTKNLNMWFRYQTNLIMPALTNRRTFLAFTNIIYSEEEVHKRLMMIDSLRSMDDALNSDNQEKQQVDQIITKCKMFMSAYNIRYIYSPYPLTGLEKTRVITRDTEVSYNYLYKVD